MNLSDGLAQGLTDYNFDQANRVKAELGGSVTVYVGAHYDKTTSGSSTTITK